MVRAVADRAFLPTRNVLEEVGDMVILTGKTIVSAIRPPYPYGGEFVSQFLFALKLCWFPLLISMVAIRLRRPGCRRRTSSTLFGAIDRLGGFFVLAVDPRVRAVRDCDHGRRRRRHGDHGRPRRAQDPRGAGRAAGARRRPGQEPRRPALPRADARDRPVRRLRDLLPASSAASSRTLVNGGATGPVLRDLLHERLDDRPVGLGAQGTLFGAIIAIICCYKGMTASGGAEGVGRAVNQAVVMRYGALRRSTTSSRRRCSPPIPRSTSSADARARRQEDPVTPSDYDRDRIEEEERGGRHRRDAPRRGRRRPRP